MIRRTLEAAALVGSLGLCGLLLFGGWQKAADVPSFREALLAHRVLPESAVSIVAAAFPWAEIAVGFLALVLLLRDHRRRLGAIVLASAFAALTVYVLLVWKDPPPLPTSCGCGLSSTPVTDWLPLVIRNAALTAVPAVLAFVTHAGSTRPRLRTTPNHGNADAARA